MSDEGATSRDLKGKSKRELRGEKHWRELEAKGKPIQRYGEGSGSISNAAKPSEECKATIFQAVYKWFKDTLFTRINRYFLALGDVIGKDAFQSHMRKVFEDTISGDRWKEDKLKFGYTEWMQDKLIDALYNTEPVLEKYRKFQERPLNQMQLLAFRTKVSNFFEITNNWSKRLQKSVAPRWPLNQFQREGESDIRWKVNMWWQRRNSEALHLR
jgi:hypothetical protein